MENKISRAYEKAKQDAGFIDLMQTNFTTVGKGLAPQLLRKSAREYFTRDRKYNPDARGLYSTRSAVAEYYQEQDLHVVPEQLLITASTSESYTLIFNTLAKAGDEVLLPCPGYPLFSYLCQYSKLTPQYYNLAETNDWLPDLASIKAGIGPRTKGIVLISPNNPTGSIISQTNLNAIVSLAEEKGLFIIFDEVFADLRAKGQDFPRPSLVTAKCPVFLFNGISKLLALPDLKLAWIVCAGSQQSEIQEELELANDTYLNANYFTQSALPLLMQNRFTLLNKLNKLLNTNRNTLTKVLTKGQWISCIIPRGGIHAMLTLEMQNVSEEEIVLEFLNEYKINLHPGYFYDLESQKPHLVISLLQDPGKFREALLILREFGIQYASSK